MGVLALKRGYAKWSESGDEATDELAPLTLAALNELRAASASLNDDEHNRTSGDTGAS